MSGARKAVKTAHPEPVEGRAGRLSSSFEHRMEDHLQAYLRSLQAERNLSPYTLRNYESDLRSFISHLETQEGCDLPDVDRHVLRRYLAGLKARGLAPGSIIRKVSSIRGFYRFLDREGRIQHNPLAGLITPKRERRVPTILTGSQIADILHAPDDDTPQALRDRAILELLYAAGLRVSELVTLDVRSVDLRAKELRVRGKGNKERIALMGAPAAEAVARYLEEGRPALVKHAHEVALFLNRLGGRLSARGVQIMLRRCAMKAGLDERVFPHLLRHTFATHMLDGEADLRVVQELLGHASVSSTQIYTHVSEAEKRKRYLEAFYNVSRTRRPTDAQDK